MKKIISHAVRGWKYVWTSRRVGSWLTDRVVTKLADLTSQDPTEIHRYINDELYSNIMSRARMHFPGFEDNTFDVEDMVNHAFTNILNRVERRPDYWVTDASGNPINVEQTMHKIEASIWNELRSLHGGGVGMATTRGLPGGGARNVVHERTVTDLLSPKGYGLGREDMPESSFTSQNIMDQWQAKQDNEPNLEQRHMETEEYQALMGLVNAVSLRDESYGAILRRIISKTGEPTTEIIREMMPIVGPLDGADFKKMRALVLDVADSEDQYTIARALVEKLRKFQLAWGEVRRKFPQAQPA